MPGDPVRRRRDPVDGRSVAGERPHRALAGRDRPAARPAAGCSRRPCRSVIRWTRCSPSAYHPGRAEAERERRSACTGSPRRRRRERQSRPATARPAAGSGSTPTPGARPPSWLRSAPRVSSAPRAAGAARRGSGPARPGSSESEAALPLEGRASTVGTRRGARPDYECRPPRCPGAKREPAAPTGCACGAASAKTSEKQGRARLANVSRKPYYLLRLSYTSRELGVRSAPCRSSERPFDLVRPGSCSSAAQLGSRLAQLRLDRLEPRPALPRSA